MRTLLRRIPPDLWAVVALVALWGLFFWRLLTPIAGDQASLKQGDFSGQFVAFGGYQYARFAAGEVPLWNPYNNGGLPFIADTQAAVFYPPRLLTIAAAMQAGGWSYHALELEMAAHVLGYSLLFYLLLRRATHGQFTRVASIGAGLVGSVTAAYGGFMTGYAPLQLAILEAATWLPLALLGLHKAARHLEQSDSPHTTAFTRFWRVGGWVVAGLGLGLSWMAGHPQTSYFLTWLMLAYWAYAVFRARASFWQFVFGAACFGGVAFGLAAVQLLPGLEYLARTARVDLTYDAKGNGFPIQDVVQFLVPGVVSLFSPLYIGIFGLIFALVAVWRRVREAVFWGGVALFALVWSFGANSVLYPLLYNLLPGLRFFRGQERAAFLVAAAGAILAGLGAAALLAWSHTALDGKHYAAHLRFRIALRRVTLLFGALSALVFVTWLANPGTLGAVVGHFAFALLLLALADLLLPNLLVGRVSARLAPILLIGVVVFDLFTLNMDSGATYDPRPASEQLSSTPPLLVAAALADGETPFRVDGFRGLTDNYGSLYDLADIRGISPLFLADAYRLIEGDDIPDAVAWELFAVRYVYTDWAELPLPSEIVETGTDHYGAVNLHRLLNPRPFTVFVENTVIAQGENAFARVRDGSLNLRATAVLDQPIASDTFAPGTAEVTRFAPEQIVIRTSNAGDGLLSISLPYYPGWLAEVDEQPAPILRAYGALSAVAIPPGEHTLTLVYNPLSYRIGAVASAGMWIMVAAVGLVALLRMRAARHEER